MNEDYLYLSLKRIMFYLEGVDFMIYLFSLISAPANNPDKDVTFVFPSRIKNKIKDLKNVYFLLKLS